MHCTNCGRENPANGKFCSGCGAPLTPMASNAMPKYEPMHQDPRPGFLGWNTFNKQGKLLFRFGMAASFLLLFAGLRMLILRSIGGSTVAESFYNSMGYATIGSAAFSAMISTYCANRISR